jgi:hypothetical protein
MRRVTTNNVPREIIEAWELTATEREQFDFLDWQAIEDGRDSAQFFRYRRELYYLGDFMAWSAFTVSDTPDWMTRWHAYSSDSFSTGLLLRYADNDFTGESGIVIGSYCT